MGYSYEQTRKIKILERNIDELDITKTEGTELVTVKNRTGQIRTAVEIGNIGYRLVKSVWITPESRVKDFTDIVNSLPVGEPEKAERNSVFDILSSKFRVTKRGE